MFGQRGDTEGITWSTDRGDRRKEEERVSKKREYDIKVGEMKERKKLRTEKRDRDMRTEVGRGLKEKEKSNKREDREK